MDEIQFPLNAMGETTIGLRDRWVIEPSGSNPWWHFGAVHALISNGSKYLVKIWTLMTLLSTHRNRWTSLCLCSFQEIPAFFPNTISHPKAMHFSLRPFASAACCLSLFPTHCKSILRVVLFHTAPWPLQPHSPQFCSINASVKPESNPERSQGRNWECLRVHASSFKKGKLQIISTPHTITTLRLGSSIWGIAHLHRAPRQLLLSHKWGHDAAWILVSCFDPKMPDMCFSLENKHKHVQLGQPAREKFLHLQPLLNLVVFTEIGVDIAGVSAFAYPPHKCPKCYGSGWPPVLSLSLACEGNSAVGR